VVLKSFEGAIMSRPTPTQRALYEMLTENTGTHFLDSGGAYGRNWERNQGRSIQSYIDQPIAWYDEYSATKSVFHYLDNRVDYIRALDNLWMDWLKQPSHYDDYASSYRRLDKYEQEYIREFAELVDGVGIYGEGEPVSHNTYNGEDALSQVIQFTLFSVTEDKLIPIEKEYKAGIRTRKRLLPADTYVLLQIHGGADVRGGYTWPRLFRVMQDDSMFDEANLDMVCEGKPLDVAPGQVTLDGEPLPEPVHHLFTSDNAGYSWYLDGLYSLETKFDDIKWNEETEKRLCPVCEAPLEISAW
jgi:hypothetical protein